jgi:hypothetical protein
MTDSTNPKPVPLSASPITSENMYLDEMTVILQRMEMLLETAVETLDLIHYRQHPWWTRARLSWQYARRMVNLTEDEAALRDALQACPNCGRIPGTPSAKCAECID